MGLAKTMQVPKADFIWVDSLEHAMLPLYLRDEGRVFLSIKVSPTDKLAQNWTIRLLWHDETLEHGVTKKVKFTVHWSNEPNGKDNSFTII